MNLGWRWLLGGLLVAAVHGAPTVAVLEGEPAVVAALEDGRLQVAELRISPPAMSSEWRDPRSADAAGLTTLAALRADLFAARGHDLVRLAGDAWTVVGRFDDPIQQLLPAPTGEELVVLTGTPAEPVLSGGKVWRWTPGGEPRRLTAILDGFRPWRLWPAAKGGRPQLGSLCYKATRHWPFEHNTLFVFDWGPRVSAAWLGSALSRPHVDATHADLRGDGDWRLVAVEVTREDGRAVSVYRPIGFGYEGEWRSEPLEGLERVRAFGDRVVLAGAGKAWELRYRAGYQIVPLESAPADLDAVARVGDVLVGREAGEWRGWPLP